MSQSDGIKIVAQNRRARHDYEIVETIECGIELKGSEVKSLREGKAQLRESYARVDNNELYVFQMHIPPWLNVDHMTKVDPDRRRRLLVHAKEIDQLRDATQQKGLTIVPLSLYFKNGRAKLEIALARGRKNYDKRTAIAARDSAREAERDMAAARRR